MSILLLIFLGQTVTPVKITDGVISKAAQVITLSDGGYALNVNSVSTGTTSVTGSVTAAQGASNDGGTDWPVQAKVWDGVDTLDLLTAAPSTDTGQASIPARIISEVTDKVSVAANLTGVGAGASFEVTGYSSIGFTVSGSAVDQDFGIEQSSDGVTWEQWQIADGDGFADYDYTASGAYSVLILPATTHIRIQLFSISSGTFTYVYRASKAYRAPVAENVQVTSEVRVLPSITSTPLFTTIFQGGNGATVSAANALKVDGSAVTQPVSGTVTAAVTGTVTANAGTNLNTSLLALDSTLTGGTQKTKLVDTGGVNVASISASNALKVDGSAVTQPVSGTVTANAGTNLNTSLLALDATLTSRSQKSQITDGTRDGTVKAASTAAQAADTSFVVALHPTSPLPTGSNVIGHTINDTGSTTAVTGNVTVVQPTGTNLHAVLDTTSTTAVTQATGTNLHAVLDATSTTAVTQATASNLNAQVQGAAANGAAKSGNPVQVGHVFNTVQPTVTNGQAVEGQATARGALIIASGADTVSVTANAGTNLNTSTLALSATQTDRTQKTQLTDGTRDGTIKPASTAAIATDTSYVVALHPSSPLPAGTSIIGALSANQSTNVAQFGGTNVSTGTGAGGAGIPRVTVSSDSSLAATVSGTVTAATPAVASANNDGACVSITVSATVLASNASRRFASVCARISNTDTAYVKFAATATTADFPLEPGQCWNSPDSTVYTGVIDAIAGSGTQSVCVMELN